MWHCSAAKLPFMQSPLITGIEAPVSMIHLSMLLPSHKLLKSDFAPDDLNNIACFLTF
jgi:hypothetical protein